MARPKTIHLVPTGSGWTVKIDGHPGKIFSTLAEALKAARMTVRDDGGVLHIQNTKGELETSFTLGRNAMAKISAVEGLALTAVSKKTFEEFDQKGLTPSQRRAALRKKAAKLAEPGRVQRRRADP